MGYNTKNYTEQGGEKTVIGGILEIKEGAQVVGLPSSSGGEIPLASDTAVGGVKANVFTDYSYNIEIRRREDGFLFGGEVPLASADSRGAIRAENFANFPERQICVEAKVNGSDQKLYVTLPQIEELSESTAETLEDLVADYNTLLAALQEARYMESTPPLG